MTTDPRITKGLELLEAYEAIPRESPPEYGPNDTAKLGLQMYSLREQITTLLWENAAFFLRDLPARVAELEEALRKARQIYWDDEADDIAHEMFHVCDAAINASLLSDSKAVDSTPTPPEVSDDLVERALGLLRDQVVTFCFLIESRDDVSNEVKQRSKGAREAVYAMGRTISALRPMPAPAVDEGKLREDSDG